MVLLYAVLCRKMGASMDFLLRVLLGVERPAALPTHSILSLMNGIDPHRLSDLLAEADGAPIEVQSFAEKYGDPADQQLSRFHTPNGAQFSLQATSTSSS